VQAPAIFTKATLDRASALLYTHDRQIMQGEFGATWGAQQR
jgi:hypothetical protein